MNRNRGNLLVWAALCILLWAVYGFTQPSIVEAEAPTNRDRSITPVRATDRPVKPALPSVDATERDWIEYIGLVKLGLTPEYTEYRLPDGSFVDVYDPFVHKCAYEVERAHKWKEAIGQAGLYQIMTRAPEAGVVLLSFDEEADKVFILRCRLVCLHYNIKMLVCDKYGVIR